MEPTYYDRAGEPISMVRWAGLHIDVEYIVVAMTRFSNDYGVSTVWTGFDLSEAIGEPTETPLIFETLVIDLAAPIRPPEYFTDPGDPGDGRLDRDILAGLIVRYGTEADALAGHAAVCDRLIARGHVPTEGLYGGAER